MHFSIPIADCPPLEFELPEGMRVVDCSRPQVTAHSNWCTALAESLKIPLGFPALTLAILPDDHVAIPVDPDTPQAAVAVRLMLEAIFATDSPPAEVAVVFRPEMEELVATCSQQLNLAWKERVRWVEHDPTDNQSYAFIAVTREGGPLYLHRALGEADVVIPLGLARKTGDVGDVGIHGGWFPCFSNLETQQRFNAIGNLRWEVHHRRRCTEAQEAAWLLGVQCAVQLLPAAAGGVLNAWCGEAAELDKLATAAYREAWHWEWEGEVDAAVAVIDGPAANQSWRNIAQALLQASRVVRVGGTIIIASQLNTQPGPALNSLIRDEHSPEEEQLALLRLRSADAVAAQIVRDCLETHRLFFQTHLEDAVIEELGCGAWHSASELERLLREHESCVVIGSAQQVSLQLRVEA